MVRFHTLAIGLTLAAACGSGAAPSSSAPAKATATRGSDAGVVVPPTSRLVCAAGTSPVPAPALEPSWYCARSDATRHGPFITLYPDGAIAVRGNHADGKLDGAWQRLHPSGAIAERGAYASGHKTGRWQQWSSGGALIGEYEMTAGTGIEKRWFDEGTPYSEVALEASVQHGATKIFSRDGSLAISARYTAGKLDGPHVFGSQSTMRMEETLAAGVRQGVRKIWLLGNLLAEEKFDRGGKLDGPYILWRRYKLPRAKGQFSHDKRIGAWLWNDRAGNKEKEGSYVAGKKDGTWTEYFEGKLVFSGQYTAGKPDGEFVYWDKLGNELGRFTITAGTGVMETFHLNKKTSSKQRLVDGVESGSYQEVTARGIVVVDGRYASGVKHGTWREYSPGGVLVLEQKWKRGKLDGFVKKYVGGKLASEATYVDGVASGRYAEYRAGKPAVTGQFAAARKIGTWQHHDAAGTVILTATYKDGVLEGPWRQVVDGGVLEGQMATGRRSGTWTRTDRAGGVSKLTYAPP